MNSKRRKTILLIVGLFILGLAIGLPYLASFFDNDSVDDPVVIGTEPPTSEQPTAEPSPSEELEEPEPSAEDEDEKYIIYTGEQLLIPVPDGSSKDQSLVVSSAALPSEKKQIALTFDAGWLYDQLIDLLDVLDDYGVKSTFFLRGKWVEDHPQLAKEITKRGHSVENHSLTHDHMKDMTDEAVRNEIAETTRLIRETTGNRPYLFRPPFGEYDKRILKILASEGYPYTVMWTIDSLDWLEERNGKKVTAQYLTDRILSNATDKGIVLMHIGGYKTVEALPDIIEGLRQDGYSLVKVNDMLPTPTTAGNNKIYTVKKGDTLYSVARSFGISPEDILAANPNRRKAE